MTRQVLARGGARIGRGSVAIVSTQCLMTSATWSMTARDVSDEGYFDADRINSAGHLELKYGARIREHEETLRSSACTGAVSIQVSLAALSVYGFTALERLEGGTASDVLPQRSEVASSIEALGSGYSPADADIGRSVGLAQARAGSILDGARPEAASSDEAGIPVLLAPVTAGIMDSRSQAVRSDETVIPVLLAPATAGIMVSRSQVGLVTTASTAPRVSYGQADLSRGYAIAKLVSTLSAARRAAYGEIASARVKATVLTSIRWSLDNVPLATLAVLTRDGASRDEVITAAEWLYNRLLPHMRPIMQPAFGYPMRQVGALFAAAKYEREARNGISALHDRITLGDFIRGAVCRSERVSVR